MFNDALKLKGKLHIVLTDAQGNVKQEIEKDNLIVQAGKDFAANALIASSTSPFSHMAVGTSGTAPAIGNTALGAEVFRKAFTTASRTGSVVTLVTNYVAGEGTGSLQEAGIFNASTAGTMLSRVTFGVITKAAGDGLSITWTITLA